VHTALSNVSTQLQSDQQQLQVGGQPQLAAVVQSVVTAVNTLDQSILQNGTLTSGISTGLAIVSGALQQIPTSLCPPPTA
jgi:replicative DNA helicase